MRVIRGNLLLLGLGVGVVIGLLSGWVVYPRDAGLASPEGLRQDYQEMYMVMVAAAHRGNGDLERARVRLEALGLSDSLPAITALAQRSAAKGRAPFDVAVLGELALALSRGGLQPAAELLPAPLPTLETIATTTPEPKAVTLTVAPTAAGTNEFKLIVRDAICEQGLDVPLLQVRVVDAAVRPLPGVLLTVDWAGGHDIFATGLYPEVGLGYADFTMTPGEVYSLQVGSQTPAARGLASEQCRAGNGVVFDGSVYLRWQRER